VTTLVEETALLSLVETIAALRAEVDGPANLAVVECTLRRGQMPPLHSHEVDEVLHVLEGTMIVHAGGGPVRLEVGDAFVAPRDVPHTQQAESDRARYLSVAFTRSVAGYEDFLRAVAVPGAPDGDEAAGLARLAQLDGTVVLGPPGALPAG
jgi:quercetin dioxygenase-like cupin family protein